MNLPSDHFPIFLTRKKERLAKEKIEIECLSFRNFDLEAFKRDLRTFDFIKSDTPVNDVNSCWARMWAHIVDICNKHRPYGKFYANSKPHFIDGLLKRMKERHVAFAHAQQTKKASDLTEAKRLRQT